MLSTFDLRCEETPHGGSGTDHGQIPQAEHLKLQKAVSFPMIL
jgi:hypothetical protein